MNTPNHTTDPNQQPEGTVFESFDDWAQLLRQSGNGEPLTEHHAPQNTITNSTAANAATHPDAPAFRPTLRRPMALLKIVDDGHEDGETVRIRGDTFVIGRTEGDLVIPHDISMSTRHAQIERLSAGGWQLADLGSARGTCVRVTGARLKSGLQFQIGSTRLRFESTEPESAWLVEVLGHGEGRRHECLPTTATTLGRIGGGCHVMIDDPFVSPVHAELRHTDRGWKIVNRGLNGLWIIIEAPVRMTATSQFQCGEQRFVFVPLVE